MSRCALKSKRKLYTRQTGRLQEEIPTFKADCIFTGSFNVSYEKLSQKSCTCSFLHRDTEKYDSRELEQTEEVVHLGFGGCSEHCQTLTI